MPFSRKTILTPDKIGILRKKEKKLEGAWIAAMYRGKQREAVLIRQDYNVNFALLLKELEKDFYD